MEKKLELPVYLFHQGTAEKAYELLGCHPENRKKQKGYVFRVWAPNAATVYLIGDFNHWEDTHPMKKITDQGIWELYVPDLEEFSLYKYSVRDGQGNRYDKCDPYGYYMERPPQTASITYNLEGYRWKDKKWRESVRKDGPMNVYEVHLGSWKSRGDGTPLSCELLSEELVSYVKDMEYTHIQLMPIAEFPFDGSLGYEPIGFYAPTSRYGTPKEWMAFIDACHAKNIGVILDWVPFHFPKDGAGLFRFDGSACYEYQDPLKCEHREWETMVFDWGRNEVRSFLLSNAMFWLEKFHVDGLHIASVDSMIYLDYNRGEGQWRPNKEGRNENLEAVAFLQQVNRAVSCRFPHAVTIAEGISPPWMSLTGAVSEGGLGFDLARNIRWKNDTLTYLRTDVAYRQYKRGLMTSPGDGGCEERYMFALSHSEVMYPKGSLINQMPGEYEEKFANLRTYLGFLMTQPGKKLLFMGGELAQFNAWNFERQLDWNLLEFPMHRKFRAYVRDLNCLYKSHSEFWDLDGDEKGCSRIGNDHDQKNIFSYIRTNRKGEELIVICNFSLVPQSKYRVGVNENGVYKPIFDSNNEIYGGSGTRMKRVRTEQSEDPHRPWSVVVDVAPLSMMVLKAYQK